MSLPASEIAPGVTADEIWGGCRLEWRENEAFGIEAIAATMRHSGFPADATGFRHGTLAGLACKDQALVIERQDGFLVRMWRIGGPAPANGEAGLIVAFDPDLAQARGDVLANDPENPAQAAAVGFGRAILAQTDAFRSRAFVLRTAGDGAAGMALFQLHLLSSGRQHRPMQARAVALWRDGAASIVRDPDWQHGSLPRLVG